MIFIFLVPPCSDILVKCRIFLQSSYRLNYPVEGKGQFWGVFYDKSEKKILILDVLTFYGFKFTNVNGPKKYQNYNNSK